MGLQTLIIFLSLISFVPDQGKADTPYQKYSLAQVQYQIAQNKDGYFPSSIGYSSPVSAPIKKITNPDVAHRISMGVEGGYAHLIIFDNSTLRMETPVLGLNLGYWAKKKIQVGLGFQYHVEYKNVDPDGGDNVSLVSFVPQVKFRLFENPLTPILGLGFGLGLAMKDNGGSGQWHRSEVLPFPIGYLGGGVGYFINENISMELNLKFIDIFLLMIGAGMEVSF
ncbi:MAG: hypothetical protein PHE84_05555 [bacterium]|nr:hypothetical protein [bacterium]